MTAPPQARGSSCRFVIIGQASAQLPLRLLGLFAQRDLLPREASFACTGGELKMSIVQPGLLPAQAAILASKLEQLVEVDAVSLEIAG